MRASPSTRMLAACCLGVWLSACGPAPSERTPPPPTPIVSSAPRASTATGEAARKDGGSGARESATPRYDLAADERRGGHTIERHIGRTDDDLRERLRREPGISAASTYTDLATAERVVARAFADSDDEVERWEARRGRRPNLVIERTEPAPIGRSLRRNQRTAAPCDHALIVLRWDERMQSSYVLTSYPECR